MYAPLEVINRMKPLGYVCSLVDEPDAIRVHCTPDPATFDRDKINAIEVFFPEREDTVNVSVLSQRGYRMNPDEVTRIINQWFKGHLMVSESHYIEAEFRGSGAKKSATAITTDIIRERRKPLVLPKAL